MIIKYIGVIDMFVPRFVASNPLSAHYIKNIKKYNIFSTCTLHVQARYTSDYFNIYFAVEKLKVLKIRAEV